MSLSLSLSDNDAFLVTDETGHTLEVATSLAGLIFLKSILAARRRFEGTPPLGTDARPSQEMVKAFLKTHAVAPAPAALTAAQITARREAEVRRSEAALAKALPYSHLDLELDL